MPAEWEPHGVVMMAWPHEATDWNYMLGEVRKCYADILRAMAGDAIAVIVGPDMESAAKMMKDAGVPDGLQKIFVDGVATNDTWTRDYGPITVEVDGTPRLLDFKFNGWGLKFPACHDNLVNRAVAEACGFKLENHLGFVLEGGSVESDGRGTVMTTSRCLLSPNRNGGMSRRQIEQQLRRCLGARRVLWLDHGYLAGDDTDSHIDTLCRFAPGDTILYTGCRDTADEHFRELSAMAEQLRSFVTADGSPYNLIELPFPDAVFDPECGERLPATYANYLVLEHTVIMPSYGQPVKDKLAAGILAHAFPGRKVLAVDCRALIRQHGSLHCSTMQIPHCFFYRDE